MIEYVDSIKNYCDKCKNIPYTKKVPVYVKDRDDIINLEEKAIKLYNFNSNREIERTFIFLSHDIEFLQESLIHLVDKYTFINFNKLDVNKLSGKVCIIGCYSDYKISNLEKLILANKRVNNIQLEFIIGRDFTSLTWMIAKQFFISDIKDNLIVLGNGMQIEEYETVKSLEDDNIKVLTMSDFNDKNVIELIQDNFYKTIIFYSHGKDDHINFKDYTLCGKYYNADKTDKTENSHNSPSCSNGGKCFKDSDKLIYAALLSAEKVILASCHSIPFCDASNYNVNYNIAMATMDSLARNVVAVSSVTRFGLRELIKMGQVNSQKDNVVELINNSLSDVQPIHLFYMFGIDNGSNWIEYNDKTINYGTSSEDWFNIIQQAKYLVCSNVFYGQNKLFNEIISILRNSILYSSKSKSILKDSRKLLNNIKQDIFSFEKHIANTVDNNYFLLGDMSSWFMESMNAVKLNELGNCDCGNKLYSYNIEDNNFNDGYLKELFCYECGDKGFEFGKGINIISNSFDIKDNQYLEEIMEVSFDNESKVVYGITFPNYLNGYISNCKKIKTIEKPDGKINKLKFEIDLSKEIPKQKHYFSIYIMQDINIYFRKFVFEII